ncbi:unnamed protein product [Heterobilharzia americana]|nr:unnamed protein product [Heterobilharzia americana]
MEIHTSCYYIMAIRRLQCIECTFLQFCILIICFIYGEILHPYVSLKAWTLPEMKPKEDEVRLLLLADPHVEGYHSSLYFFSDILQADSDDYLRFHFVKAVQYANPNGVVFLGDLLDTGETASDSEFMLVVSRFYEIFLSETDLFVILVPGDNDVGGEGVSVTEAKLNRFYTKLPVKLKKNKFKFVSFYSDNMQSEAKADFQNEKSSSEITVFISHFPVVSKYHTWFPMNLLQSNASMSIHGHLHRSQVIHWKTPKIRKIRIQIFHRFKLMTSSNRLHNRCTLS